MEKSNLVEQKNSENLMKCVSKKKSKRKSEEERLDDLKRITGIAYITITTDEDKLFE